MLSGCIVISFSESGISKESKSDVFIFANPSVGSSEPWGASNVNSSPLSRTILSDIGLKLNFPAIVNAVTISGLATNDSVAALPSLRFAKFLLKELIIVFFSPSSTSDLCHCPIHGPQAFASTSPPSS